MEIPQAYLDRIRTYLPDVPIATIRLTRDGLQYDVVILNDVLVVRFAKDEGARAAVQHERVILDLVRQYVQLPTPQVDQCSEEAMIYRFIPGLPLVQDVLLRLDEADQEHMAGQLALFVVQLHGIPRAALTRSAIGTSPAARTDEDWQTMFEAVQRELFPHLWEHARAWVRRLFAPVLSGELSMVYTPVLIHGDLAGYHLLHDARAQRLTGVIDFGTAGLGDAATDLACLIQVLGESFVRRMLRHQPTLGAALHRARFRAAAVEVEWALQGLRTNDPGWWTAHLGNARDALPLLVPYP